MVCLQMFGNYLTNQGPENIGNSAEHGQKLVVIVMIIIFLMLTWQTDVPQLQIPNIILSSTGQKQDVLKKSNIIKG